jgi:GTPase SAR1 family protein
MSLSGNVPQRRVFISYHHDLDQAFADALIALHHGDSFYSRSLTDEVRSMNPVYVMRVIRENHLTGASVIVVLCGKDTCLRKYVDREILAALRLQMGLVVVKLPFMTIPPPRATANVVSAYAVDCTWNEFISDPSRFIEASLARPKALIANNLGALLCNSHFGANGQPIEQRGQPKSIGNTELVFLMMCQIRTKRQPERMGTGFFISSSLVMTSAHIFGDNDNTEEYFIEMSNGTVMQLDSKTFFVTSSSLDFTVIAVHGENPCKIPKFGSIQTGEEIYILRRSHDLSGGEFQLSYVFDIDEKSIYSNASDLQSRPGSSGSPIFNCRNRIVGVHQALQLSNSNNHIAVAVRMDVIQEELHSLARQAKLNLPDHLYFQSGSTLSDLLERGGHDARRLYNAALLAGSAKRNRVRVIVCGEDKVGKTSLVRSLRGDPFREEHLSTEGIDVIGDLQTGVAVHRAKRDSVEKIAFEALLTLRRRTNVSVDSDNSIMTDSQTKAVLDLVRSNEENVHTLTVPVTASISPHSDSPIANDKFVLGVWDFAGQLTYTASHQIFLSKGCLYVIVANLSTWGLVSSQERVCQWLRLIHSIARSRCRILIVGTHADELVQCGVNPQLVTEDMRTDLVRQCGDLICRDLLKTTCFVALDNRSALGDPEASGLFMLNTTLQSQAEFVVDKDPIPLSWLQLECRLTEFKSSSEKNSIMWSEVVTLARESGIDEEAEVCVAIEYLHTLGVVLRFQHSQALRDLVIIRPQWIVDSMKALIAARSLDDAVVLSSNEFVEPSQLKLLKSKGKASGLLLAWVWRHYKIISEDDARAVDSMIDLMISFNLLFRVDETYFIPALLPEEKPQNAFLVAKDESHELNAFVRFSEPGFPAGFFTKLIAYMHNKYTRPRTPTIWQGGMVLRVNSLRVFLQRSISSFELYVVVRGANSSRIVGTCIQILHDIIMLGSDTCSVQKSEQNQAGFQMSPIRACCDTCFFDVERALAATTELSIGLFSVWPETLDWNALERIAIDLNHICDESQLQINGIDCCTETVDIVSDLPELPTVFVSHAWEDDKEQHEKQILDVVEALEHNGFRVRVDCREKDTIHKMGLSSWMTEMVTSSGKVLLLCSPTYQWKCKSDRDQRRATAGVQYETFLMENEIARCIYDLEKFIPVIMTEKGATRAHIPLVALQASLSLNWPQEREELLRRLRGTGSQIRSLKPTPNGHWLSRFCHVF